MYDVIVVGAGHAGCEAACVAARMGARTILLTHDLSRLATQPCNPAVGGVGKGHIVREVSACGGLIGEASDGAGIQFRTLNTSKGPAVRATRVQTDSQRYVWEMTRRVLATRGLEARPARVVAVETVTDGGRSRVAGARLSTGEIVRGRCVVVATGTFLDAVIHIGEVSRPAGRAGEPPARSLARSLASLGLTMRRHKTGTCPRVDPSSLDFSAMHPQPGDDPAPMFTDAYEKPPLAQVQCHITATCAQTHRIIEGSIDRSPLFGGTIQGTGTRYCPSIEDKVVRFPHHDRHVIFLEPEGLDARRIYLSGLSTSLPADVQEKMVRSLPGCSNARILRFGYAVEYDFVDGRQLSPSLQVMDVAGLFLAGQINGTSGYEEAAGQGLLAGINAALVARDEDPVVLGRDVSYVGVMVDDLATRGIDEPYRMLTARAEYRLILREDNADARMMPVARSLGLVDDLRWQRHRDVERRVDELVGALQKRRLGKSDSTLARRLTQTHGISAREGTPLADLLHQPGPTLDDLLAPIDVDPSTVSPMVASRVTTRIRYEGYIARERRRAGKLLALDSVRIPSTFGYTGMPGLSLEVVEKLEAARPTTLGQASRIAGITPAAVSLLQVLIKKH